MVSSEGGGNSQDIDLNLAPIIDCFTVLITYLLLSASFISLAVFDVTVAADSAEVVPTEPPPVSFTIGVNQDGTITIQEDHPDHRKSSTDTIPAKNGTWDYQSLVSKMQELHQQFPKLEGGMLTADDKVKYGVVVKAVEKVKTVFPQLALSPEYKIK